MNKIKTFPTFEVNYNKAIKFRNFNFSNDCAIFPKTSIQERQVYKTDKYTRKTSIQDRQVYTTDKYTRKTSIQERQVYKKEKYTRKPEIFLNPDSYLPA